MQRDRSVRELSLFTGAGGGLLGTHLLGWQPVGYVEFNDYCQRVIKARIEDGILREAPIFGDIRAFNSEGYAERYQGMVDVITAGFPCQPFSVAGKQAGEDDPRNMWPATIECIRIVQPRFALLENVPGLLASGYFGRILGDLAESGYDARWRVLSAAEVGAPHLRDRLWIMAHSDGSECRFDARTDNGEKKEIRRENQSDVSPECCSVGGTQDVAHSYKPGLSEPACSRLREFRETQRTSQGSESCRGNTEAGGYWTIEPDMGRVANGVAYRVDRLKAIGNGQVPAVVKAAWELLNE
jgi:DNA (cytosine-5)-methyltransferase 1